ncbi:lectin [Roseicella aquatilis]|uniref:Lectin n=1 Tax=Roseicella aquatilis TaxID=2527868 RepID=A0A4V2WLK0_9PROT|nr:lectin [Roseicella aquatilis]TCZ63020.1 lectin [Roseicella aquatilis]
MIRSTSLLALAALAVAPVPVLAQGAPQGMSFFVTSANPGRGGDLGGLAGADAHCQSLARAAGAGHRTWRAYLSTQGPGAVNARDRIGGGPWRNAKGEVVARSLADLHGEAGNLTKQTALTETGEVVKGRGDSPNMHDILTGSQPDGTAFAEGEDRTCRNWTSGDAGSAMVGHSDRIGLNDSPPMKSWNTSHPSRGCGMEALRATGGAGLFYCFAAD